MQTLARKVVRTVGAVALAAAVAAPLASPGVAASNPKVALDGGHFVDAYDAASAVDTAASQVLAATAASDYAVYVLKDGRQAIAWLDKARDAAQRAVDLQPRDAAALVQLARAKGEIARRAGVLESVEVVHQLKDLFDRALKIDPDNPNALVGLAMWNLELTQRGVGWLFGARKQDVLPLLERGVAQAPEQVNLHVEYATALRALGRPDAARQQLETALALPARTAADRFEQERAAALLGP